MELKKYKLADIAKIEISGVDKKTMDGETHVRLCNFVDVYYNWAITKEKAKSFMVASAKQAEIDKCSIGKGMVAITKDSETRDDIGVATYIADNFENVVLGYHCALIAPNSAIVDGKYLNAFMHTCYIQKYFENNASGSGQRYTLSNDTIGNIPVLLPSIEEQHIIGKVLADIDRKIELNKQINDNLLLSTGMRVGELVKINRDDIDFQERQCVVFGKGNKEREVYFNARTKIHLKKYLEQRTDTNPALFVSLHEPHTRLTISGVEVRLRQLGKRVNLNKVHPHKFRRTLATMAIDKGMPIEQVQKMLGHVKIDTTLHYAMVNQTNVKIAHRKFLN